jgi:Ni,Fe-hydrogenase III component G
MESIVIKEDRISRKWLADTIPKAGCRRIKEWIKENRHLKGAEYIKALNKKLQGHYNYYNVPGNLHKRY